MSANAAKKAGEQANNGTMAGIAEQQAARQQAQENAQPYMQFGQNSMNNLNALNSGDYSGFMNSPDYLYAQQAGTQALDRGAAANGNLWGGGADADRIALGQGLATQYMGNYRNALQFGVTQGQAAAAGDSANAMTSANNIGGAYGQMGFNSANATTNQANAWANTANNLGSIYNRYQGQKQQGGG